MADKVFRVFPAWAGMNRPERQIKHLSERVPRVGGDEPSLIFAVR